MPNNRALLVAYLFTLLTVGQLAAADEDRGVIFYERFLGSTNTLGNVFRLDTTVGYSFNKHFSVDGGLPLFFVRPSGTATALGGIPYFTTNGGTQNFLVLVNPLTTTVALTLQLFDATGTKQGADLNRSFSGRSLQVLSIPGVFGVTPTPPTSGSVRITAGGPGFLGWLVMAQSSTGRVQFTAVGLDADNVVPLPVNAAP